MVKRKATRKWMFPSTSTEGKFYAVTRWDDGQYSCNCPAWTFKRAGQERGCLHIAGVLASLALPPGFQVTGTANVPLPQLVEAKPKRKIVLDD